MTDGRFNKSIPTCAICGKQHATDADCPPITLNELMTIANEAYPDGHLSLYWHFEGEGSIIESGSGDPLAEFVVHELSGTFDPESNREEQLAEARRVLAKAVLDLEAVILHLDEAIEG